MKKWEDVQRKLKDELEKWFYKQCRNLEADYFMFYLPASLHHDSNLIICQKVHPDTRFAEAYILVSDKRINKGLTVEQNYRHFESILFKLPVITPTDPSEGWYNTEKFPHFVVNNGAWDIYRNDDNYCAAIPTIGG